MVTLGQETVTTYGFMRQITLSLRRLVSLAGTSLLLVLPACADRPRQAVLEQVGPAPRGDNTAPSNNSNAEGFLVVYSAWSNFVDQGSTAHHSRYTIASDDGKVSREVINHVDRFDEGPLELPLAPGAYQIRARSAHFGRVTVPVLIQEHRTTYVYLDGASRPDARLAQQTAAVKLPNGEIVGWSTTVARNGAR
jgi:hypothetical protein